MPAPFSPFELLLLQSRRPADTASLLILSWILVNKTQTLAEDQQYLRSLAHTCNHDGALDTLIEVARQQPLTDIQLAAEVLLQERHDTALSNLLTRAIGLAAGGGAVSAHNQQVLGLIADLAGIQHAAFSRLFHGITGRWPQAPTDLSRHDYWPSDEQATDADSLHPGTNPLRVMKRALHALLLRLRARRRLSRRQARHRRWQREHQRRHRHEQAQHQRYRQHQDQQRQRYRREHDERQQQYEREQQHHSRRTAGDGWRRRLALQVLELEEPVSRHEIKRAYRRLAQRHHPDRFYGQGERRMALAAQRFQRIRDAYDYLIEHA